MMSLVAYDESSNSEIEEDNDDETKNENSVKVVSNKEVGNLFKNLPKPKEQSIYRIPEDQDEILFKKEIATEIPPKRIKIDVPSLSGFDDDDEEDSTFKKETTKLKNSGLFALLPAPKESPLTNTSFVPNVLNKKVNRTRPTKVVEKYKPIITNTNESNCNRNDDGEDDDTDDVVSETFDDDLWQKVCGKKKNTNPRINHEEKSTIKNTLENVELAPDVSKPYEGLANKEFKDLVGNSKKIKENIKLIDIHEDEIRPDKEQWLKSLTDPNYEPEVTVENPVDGTRKVKNHITSLAQKAIANDKELQARWAENRFTRNQTRAKYGF